MRYSYFPLSRERRQFHIDMLSLQLFLGRPSLVGNDIRWTYGNALDGSERIWGVRESIDFLNAIVVDFGEGTLVVIGGAGTESNIARFIQQSSALAFGADFSGVSPMVAEIASNVFNLIHDRINPIHGPIFMAGYSLGGCICYELAAQLRERSIPTSQIWTYGSPRPGGSAAQARYASTPTKRFYAINDPIRSIPPHFSEAWSMWPLVNQATRNRWNAQVQVPTGICIDGGGNFFVNEDLNPVSGGDTIFSLVSYWLGLETDVQSVHSVANYQAKFALVADSPTSGPIYPSRPRGEQPASPTPTQTREIIARGVVAQEVAARAPAPPMTIVVGTQQSGMSTPYHPRKSGELWVVVKDNQVVDIGPGKRAAHHKAKRWNRASRVR